MNGRFVALLCVLLCVTFVAAARAGAQDASPASGPGANARPVYKTRTIEGWTVHVNAKMLDEQSAPATNHAIELLTEQLKGIVRVVPPKAVERLREVALWINPEYPKVTPRAEYHPGAGWLRENGRDPNMVKGVEITNVRIFEAECRRMPVFVLHELAHSYHDRVLGFDQPEVVAAYRKAKAAKKYDAVKRRFGNPSRPETVERAYAMTNEKEYFAECTEAYFGENDFFPFNAAELKAHDPEMYALLGTLWGVTPAKE